MLPTNKHYTYTLKLSNVIVSFYIIVAYIGGALDFALFVVELMSVNLT